MRDSDGCNIPPAVMVTLDCDDKVKEITYNKCESNVKVKEMTMFEAHRAQWWIDNPGPDETKEERYTAAEDEYNSKYHDAHTAECEQWVADMEHEKKMYKRYFYMGDN